MFTSVVSLVTRPAVLNLSRLAKEKVWMFSNIACRRFLAKPVDARAPYLPPITPVKRPRSAAPIISAPTTKMWRISPASTPSSMMDAIRKGIRVSNTTSRTIKIGVMIDAFLYSFICAANVFIMSFLPCTT